jgi:hypothetical protein
MIRVAAPADQIQLAWLAPPRGGNRLRLFSSQIRIPWSRRDFKMWSRAMMDEDADNKFWEARLKSGNPIFVYEFDPPFKITFDKEGGLSIDCPCMKIGTHETAAVIRVRLTPLAIKELKDALETIPDAPSVEAPRRPVQ